MSRSLGEFSGRARPPTGYLPLSPPARGVQALLIWPSLEPSRSEREVVFSQHRTAARKGRTADGAQAALVGVLVNDLRRQAGECLDLGGQLCVGDRLDHDSSLRAGGEEAHQA